MRADATAILAYAVARRVGKTLSARHYANWDRIEACSPYRFASDAEFAALLGSYTIFYTPKVVNSPKQIEQDIQGWCNRLRAIPLEAIRREEEGPLERARQQDEASKHAFFLQTIETLYAPPAERSAKPASMVEHVVKTYAQTRAETPEPTTLLMIDETDRLKTAGLEHVDWDAGVRKAVIALPSTLFTRWFRPRISPPQCRRGA
jgi:hypothetical protein